MTSEIPSRVALLKSNDQKIVDEQLPFVVKNTVTTDDDDNKVTVHCFEEDPDDYSDPYSRDNNTVGKLILYPRRVLHKLIKKPIFKNLLLCFALVLFVGYFITSMILKNPFKFPQNVDENTLITNYIFSNNTTLALLSLTIIVVSLITWDRFIVRYIDKLSVRLESHNFFESVLKSKNYISWIVTISVFLFCVFYVIYDMDDYNNLKSLYGILFLVALCCVSSYYPSDINWRVFIVGMIMQIFIGIVCIRSKFGYELFKFLGDKMIEFLFNTNSGTTQVFGEGASEHYLAFRALPIALFFGGIVNVLYYLGFLQYFILKFSWVMNKLMNTSPTESMIGIASIFLGKAESSVLVSPFLDEMTVSELFTVMLAGYATVAGSTMAAYTGFGVQANHLLIASLMSSPASLTLSKLIYPETSVTKADWKRVKNLPKGEEKNVIEAFSVGATNMLAPIGCIITNLIAFRALLTFLDTVVVWLLSNLNLLNFGLVKTIQYPFSILAIIMGVDSEDSLVVGNLIAVKIFISEFISYQELGATIRFREAIIANGTYDLYRNGTLSVPSNIAMLWNEKSAVMTTYALCGFASFASIGICIGAFSALAPKRSKVFARLAGVAMIFGNVTCCLTACFAGLLYKQQS